MYTQRKLSAVVYLGMRVCSPDLCSAEQTGHAAVPNEEMTKGESTSYGAKTEHDQHAL